LKNSQALQSTVFKTCVVALGYLALAASSRSFVSASACRYGMELDWAGLDDLQRSLPTPTLL